MNITRYFQLDRRQMTYFKFILEAYEGLSTLSTVEGKSGTVVLSYSSCFSADMDRLIDSLGKEIALTELPSPLPRPD